MSVHLNHAASGSFIASTQVSETQQQSVRDTNIASSDAVIDSRATEIVARSLTPPPSEEQPSSHTIYEHETTVEVRQPSKSARKKARQKANKAMKQISASASSSTSTTTHAARRQLSLQFCPDNNAPSTSNQLTLSIASQEQPDPSKYFYNITVCNAITLEMAVLIIPASIMPQDMQQHFLQQQILEGVLPDEETREERINDLKSKKKCPTYEVSQIEPLQIHGLNRKEVFKFKKKYIFDSLDRAIRHEMRLSQGSHKKITSRFGNESLAVQQPSDRSLYLSNKETDMFLQAVTSEANSCSIDKVFEESRTVKEIFSHLRETVIELIKRHGQSISPLESMRHIFDLLSISLIQENDATSPLKDTLISQVIQHWTKTLWHLNSYSDALRLQNVRNAEEHFQELMDQFDSYINSLKQHETEKNQSLISSLIEIQKPLVELLKASIKLTQDSTKQIFCTSLAAFQNAKLKDESNVTEKLTPSRNLIRKRLNVKANFIEQYSMGLFVVNDPSLQLLSTNIKTALNLQNWNEAYQSMKSLEALLKQHRVEKLGPIKINQTINYLGQPELVISPSMPQFAVLRLQQILGVLIQDFETIILNGQLIQPVSELAYLQLQRSCKELYAPPVEGSTIAPNLIKWGNALSHNKQKELNLALKDLSGTWKDLKAIHEQLRQKDKYDLVSSLIQNIENEEYPDFLSNYSAIIPMIKNELIAWGEGLQRLNNCIHKVQDVAFLLAVIPGLPTIDIQTLREQFVQLNKRFLAIVQPTTLFFNAFQRLLQIPSKTPSVSGPSGAIALDFVHHDFSLSLFDTRPKYYEGLIDQLSSMDLQTSENEPVIELEEEVEEAENELEAFPTPQLSSRDNSQELTEGVQRAFHSTKTRIILHELKELMKERGILFSTMYGKGSHNKLFINGVAIPLPKRTEWAPGTEKSIQNDVLEQLKAAIAQNQRG